MTDYRVHPLVRSYGKARIEITRQAKDEQEWQMHWRAPQNPFSLEWGDTWKQCVEYKVEDFASEVGFFIDLLGFPVHTFSPSYARLTTPDGDFYFAISEARAGEQPTPAEALRLQFCVVEIEELLQKLESRGISIEEFTSEEVSMWKVASIRTPHGIWIDFVAFKQGEDDSDESDDVEEDFEHFEPSDEIDIPEADLINESEPEENDIQVGSEIDPIKLALSQGEDDQDADEMSPFIKSYSHHRDSSIARRPRVRSAPRLNNFNFNDLKQMPSRERKPDKTPGKPRSNGEITYVELEDEDEF